MTFSTRFSLSTATTDDPLAERRIENVQDERGETVAYSYLIASGKDNLIMEEFRVFAHQG